jgi:RNA polymerase sigma-70 factor (ECF subfamily)
VNGVAVVEMGMLTAEDLARDHTHRVYRFAAMLCRNRADAEDLTQEALLRAMRALPRFDPRRGEIGSWLWRIVVNVARDGGRAASRAEALWERLARESRAHAAVNPESVAIDRLSGTALLDAVRRLPRRYRTLIALRFGAELAYEEIGDLLGENPSALRQAMHRALGRLRAQLAQLEDKQT